MLNISKNSVGKEIHLSQFKSGRTIINNQYYRKFNRLALYFLGIIIVILFLPWTQNITGEGHVTTLMPGQRPQTLQSPIPGRVEEWFVREGDYVNKGDTILRISEVKSDYFDDKLIDRTAEQIESKSLSADSYKNKTAALTKQINALKSEQVYKLQQAKNKLRQAELTVTSDSIDLEAAKVNNTVAQTQYDRVVSLNADGLKATKDVEDKRIKLQKASAELVSKENKLLASKNSMINAKIELSSINASYADKISKTESELYSAQSAQFNTQAEVSKLENTYSNYEKRTSLRYVTAPQNGYVNKAIIGGIGETFKEGQSLVKIMPADYDLAVATYIRPIDLPLIHLDEKVRVQFDGWPAIVFRGWESVSYGTYGARVVAIENYIDDNGKYRVLLAPDKDDHEWPSGLRVGSGAKTIALLNDVPIWYELWRQLNGFPPNFYTPNKENGSNSK